MTGGTVKQFKDALEEMRKIYPFDDEKTRMDTHSVFTNNENNLTIITIDEETGIGIQLTKNIPYLPLGE